MNARRQSRGFLLLEAVAAIALLGLALPAILSAFADTVSRAAQADDRLDALRRAQDLITLASTQFHGEKEARTGSDTKFNWDVVAVPMGLLGGERLTGSINTIPVQVTATVRSRRGAITRLDTLFLFSEAVR